MGAASIPLAVQTPQPTPILTSIGQLMNLRDMGTQIALRQAQTQQALQQSEDIKAQAAQRQRALQDQQTIQDALKDPAISARMHTGDFSDIESKVLPSTLDAVRQKQIEYMNSLVANSKAKNELRDTALSKAADTVTGLQQFKNEDGTPDLDRINAALPGAVSNLHPYFQQAGIQGDLPAKITDPKQLDNFLATIGAERAALSQAAKLQEDQAKPALTQAQTKEATSKAAESQAQADLIQRKVKTLNDLTPQTLGDLVNARIPAQFPDQRAAALAAAQTALKTATDLKDVREAIEGVAKNVDEIQKTGNPTMIAGEAARAAATERATAPIKINEQVQAELQKAKLAGGLGQIVDPQARNDASRQYDAAATEAANTYADSARLKGVIQQAQSGNKVAPTLESIEELRSIVNRVNRNELAAVQGAGSAIDSVKGWIGGHVSGQPIPDNIQKDLAAIADAQQVQAQNKMALKIGLVNAKNNSHIAVPDLAGIYGAATGGGTIGAPKKMANAADYNALPKGAKYIDPEGNTRTKQ